MARIGPVRARDWTAREVAVLRECRAAGLSFREIADSGRLPARSVHGIKHKCRHAGIDGMKGSEEIGRAIAVPLPATMWNWLDHRRRELLVTRPEIIRRALAAAMARPREILEEWR